MKRLFPVLLFLLALVFVWPLFSPGYIPTHDGEFSIIRIWQFTKVLRAGIFPPRWAPDLNSGYGVPLFIFYYPLPYFMGSLIHSLGFSLVDSFKLTLAISYLAAVIFSFWWLAELFGKREALVGSLLFMSVPYWFVDIYVRGSVGETMAVAWFVLALAAATRGKIHLASLAVAGLLLSHNIAAILFLPVLVGYFFWRGRQFIRSLVWAFGLSAFFWLPALWEQQWVIGLSNFDWRDHFALLPQLFLPSWGTGFSRPGWPVDEMSLQIGVGVLIVVASTIIIWLKEKNVFLKRFIAASLGLAGLVVFLMLEVSAPVWEKVSPLGFVQYPWRLLIYFIPLVGLWGSYLAQRCRPVWLPLFLGVMSLFLALPYIRPVVYEVRSDSYYLSRREFTDGTTTVGNSFSTRWLTGPRQRPRQKVEVTSGSAIVSELESHTGDFSFLWESSASGRLRVNVAYYPGWLVWINGQSQTIINEEGVLNFSVPAGSHKIRVSFGETAWRQLANLISVLSLFWLIGSAILTKDYAHRHRHHTTFERS